jgi:hypothetical protein
MIVVMIDRDHFFVFTQRRWSRTPRFATKPDPLYCDKCRSQVPPFPHRTTLPVENAGNLRPNECHENALKNVEQNIDSRKKLLI